MRTSPLRLLYIVLVAIALACAVGSVAGIARTASAVNHVSDHQPPPPALLDRAARRVSTDTLNMPTFWNGPLHSGMTIATDGQARLLPGLDDEVRLIVQLTDEPLAEYINQTFSSSRLPDAAEAAAISRYADRLAESHRRVLAQMEQSGVEFKVNREFIYLVNGLAISTPLREWSRLKSLPQVKSVQPDYAVHADLSDSVPLIGAPPVWNMVDSSGHPVTGLGVRVAIIDTGIDYTHPDLGSGFGVGHRVIGGYDFVNNDGDPFDDHGHGTHVAGIVAASGVVTGAAPAASLLAYKALDASGSGSDANVIAAIERAVDPDGNPLTNDSANVINLSLTGPGNPDDLLSQAVDQAAAQGVIVVAAAGNSGPSYESMGAPASARRALTVAASDKTDVLADFSSRGPIRDYLGLLKPDITAPGVSIRSTVPTGGQWGSPDRYNTLSGTSMAAPHIAGAAALIKQLHPTWTPDMIKANLMNTAKNLGGNGYVQGAGRVQVNAAAASPLIAVPGSLSFGRPALGVATSLPLTLTNISSSALTATASISTVLWDNGSLDGTTIPLQVSYAQLGEPNLAIPAGGTVVLAVNLNVPGNAPGGYYIGQIVLRGQNYTVTVPFAFSLLSRMTVHVLDETGAEWLDPWSYTVQLFRVPAVDVQKNNWGTYAVPFSMMVPAGTYHVYATARVYWYTPLLENWGTTPWKPLILAKTVTITQNSDTSVYLDARLARHFTLAATTFAGNPLFVHQMDAGYRYQANGKAYNAMFGFSYADNASTDLHGPLPSTLDLYVSDTPAGSRFDIGIAGFGFSPPLQHFNDLNSAKWLRYPDPQVPPGLAYRQWADEVHLYAWAFPTINATTPTTLTYARNEVGRYHIQNDMPGILSYSPTYEGGFYSGFDTLSFMPHGIFPFAAGAIAGVNRDVFYRGSFYYQFWPTGGNHFSALPFFDRNLQPLPPTDGRTFRFGGGPLRPAVRFSNNVWTIHFTAPSIVSADGSQVNWDGGCSNLTLYRDGAPIYGTCVNDYGAPDMDWSIDWVGWGHYRWLLSMVNDSPIATNNLLEAGFTLTSTLTDRNPPYVTDVDMPQRFSQSQLLTVTLTITDAESGVADVQLRYSLDDGASWSAAPVTQAGAQYHVSIPTDDAVGVTLNYTATDFAGNYLAFTTSRAAIQGTPVNLALNATPLVIPLVSQPITVTISGTLLRTDNHQPLSNVGLPVTILVNDQLAGYVRDIVRRPDGTIEYGAVHFDWTFIPTDFFTTTGPAQLKFVFDTGTYARQEEVLNLSVATPRLTYLPLVMNNANPSPTHELIVNGGFEQGLLAWQWSDHPDHANVVTDVVHSGMYAAKFGIEPPDELHYSTADAATSVGVLYGAPHARLSFWYWPRREGVAGDPAHSRQFAYVLEGDTILQKLFEFDENLSDWQYAEFDLSPYAGRSISIQFGVYHDGNAVYGKRSWLYVDDVSLVLDASSFPVDQDDEVATLWKAEH